MVPASNSAYCYLLGSSNPLPKPVASYSWQALPAWRGDDTPSKLEGWRFAFLGDLEKVWHRCFPNSHGHETDEEKHPFLDQLVLVEDKQLLLVAKEQLASVGMNPSV